MNIEKKNLLQEKKYIKPIYIEKKTIKINLFYIYYIYMYNKKKTIDDKH